MSSLGTFVVGDDWKIGFTVTDSAGAALNLAASGRTLILRLRLGTTTIQRSTAVTAEREWVTDGTDGKVYFLVAAAVSVTLTPGRWHVSLFVDEVAPLTPRRETPIYAGALLVEAPAAGQPV